MRNRRTLNYAVSCGLKFELRKRKSLGTAICCLFCRSRLGTQQMRGICKAYVAKVQPCEDSSPRGVERANLSLPHLPTYSTRFCSSKDLRRRCHCRSRPLELTSDQARQTVKLPVFPYRLSCRRTTSLCSFIMISIRTNKTLELSPQDNIRLNFDGSTLVN
jgi:hypothetical protein